MNTSYINASHPNASAVCFKKNDLFLAAVLFLLAAAAGSWFYFTHRTPALRAEVTVDGTLVETLDLSQDQELTISGAGGGSNRLIVEDGAVWCAEASCPDHICIQQGKQSADGGLIVCLPNKMVVQVIGTTN